MAHKTISIRNTFTSKRFARFVVSANTISAIIGILCFLCIAAFGFLSFDFTHYVQSENSSALTYGVANTSADMVSISSQLDADRSFFASKYVPYMANGFSVGMWNIQILGQQKWGNVTLRTELLSYVSLFDIAIVQEIRDAQGVVVREICEEMGLRNYSCIYGVRAGRTSATEQYALFFRSNASFQIHEVLDLADATQFNGIDYYLYWERPPLLVVFEYAQVNFTLATIHVRPSDAVAEIGFLDKAFADETDPFILIGDLNADCAYYRQSQHTHFAEWHWIIPAGYDTTLSERTCAYDRIIVNSGAYAYFAQNYGIITENITTEHSDHYPIWAQFRVDSENIDVLLASLESAVSDNY